MLTINDPQEMADLCRALQVARDHYEQWSRRSDIDERERQLRTERYHRLQVLERKIFAIAWQDALLAARQEDASDAG